MTELRVALEGYLDLRWRMDPVEATYHGKKELDAQLPRFDRESQREFEAALTSYTSALEEADADQLADEIDRTAALHAARHDLLILKRERPHVRNPTVHLDSVLTGIHLLLVRPGRTPEHRAQALLGRLQALPGFLETAKTVLDHPPPEFVETAQAMIPGALELIRDSIDESGLDWTSLEPGALADAQNKAEEALRTFADALTLITEGEPGSYAIGRELFDRKLHTAHVFQENADALMRFGERLRDEAHAQVERVSAEIAPGEPWRAVAERLRREVPEREQAVFEFSRALRSARDFTEARQLVCIPPGGLSVVPTPPFLRELVPIAAYQGPGALDDAQDGMFFVTMPPPNERWRGPCLAELPATALHEGVPGHHLQIVTANRSDRLVRRVLGTPAAREGWALYCETMMAEEGFIASPSERFFQAHHLLWRAFRVILDVAMHTRGMSVSTAAALLHDELGLDPGLARAEARRYAAFPTYQLCYAVGRRDILALREDAQRERGTSYSARAFHDELLGYGAFPTALARWGMGLA